MPGRAIVVGSHAANGIFAVTGVPAAAGVDTFDAAALTVALASFFVAILVWIYAFGLAMLRTARGDDITVSSLFLAQGPAPASVRLHLYGAVATCIAITAGTAGAEPFGILVPMLPLGLVGLWGARHGAYPERPTRAARPARRRR